MLSADELIVVLSVASKITFEDTGLYASFLKGQGHQGIFSLAKGTLGGNCKFLLEHFKGTKAMARGNGGNGGNCLRCLREVSGLLLVIVKDQPSHLVYLNKSI